MTLSEHQGHSIWNQLYCSAVFSIIPSLKQISSQVSWYMTMLSLYFTNHVSNFLHLILLVQNKFSMNFNNPTGCGNKLNLSKLKAKFARKWTQRFLISYTSTLNDGQGHPNLYENVELSSLYHHTKFQEFDLPMSENKLMLNIFFNEIMLVGFSSKNTEWTRQSVSLRFITPSLHSITNSIQTDQKLCKITDSEVFAF